MSYTVGKTDLAHLKIVYALGQTEKKVVLRLFLNFFGHAFVKIANFWDNPYGIISRRCCPLIIWSRTVKAQFFKNSDYGPRDLVLIKAMQMNFLEMCLVPQKKTRRFYESARQFVQFKNNRNAWKLIQPKIQNQSYHSALFFFTPRGTLILEVPNREPNRGPNRPIALFWGAQGAIFFTLLPPRNEGATFFTEVVELICPPPFISPPFLFFLA